MIYVTSQLAIMVDTGISLSAALGGIVEQETNPTLRRVLKDLKDGGRRRRGFLRRPGPLSQTTSTRPTSRWSRPARPPARWAPMLDRIATYLRKELETRSKVRAAMAYPAVMMVVATGVTIFLLTYILPKFTPLFKSRGTQAARRRRW